MTAKVNVFFSYAHTDEELRDKLEKHLSILRHRGLIANWHDRQILPGADWGSEIDQQLDTAHLILLLVSPDFISSDYIWSVELKKALKRHKAGNACVIPIIMRPVNWRGAPFAGLQALPKNALAVTSWNNIDEALKDVAQGIEKAVEEQNRKLVNTAAASVPPKPRGQKQQKLIPASPSPLWNIPGRRNPYFIGREDILKSLHSMLVSSNTAPPAQPPAISGLGGIGKTQTAIEYAYRFRHEYNFVFWVRADVNETLVADFVAIANLLNLPEKNAKNQNLTVIAVKRWLGDNKDWLLIFDNVDDLLMAHAFLPVEHQGHILLTTHINSMGGIARRIDIEEMEPEDGALFLLRRAGIIASDAHLVTALEADQILARSIAQTLNGLPLALDQAGAFIEETKCGLADYLQLYTAQAQRTELLKRRGGIAVGHPEPVATTWSLSFEKVATANPAASGLLRFFAFLHPNSIPEEMVVKGLVELGTELESIASKPVKLNEAIGELLKYSLVRRNARTKTISVHRLVQEVLQDEMDEKTKRQWVERVVSVVNKVFPEVAFEAWPLCQKYLPHALLCGTFIERWKISSPESACLLNQAGLYLSERGQDREALPLYQQALAIREQVLGLNHLDTAASLNNLAELYRRQRRFIDAEPLYLRALAIREHVLGPDHPDTATSLSNLGALYGRQERYEQAEELYLRALAIRERVLGPDHLDTAVSLSKMGALYLEKRKYEQAEELYLRALAIRERVLGPDHPDMAASLNNLANLYKNQEKYEQAEELYLRALATRELVLGSDHPDMAASLNNLANLYKNQEKYEQAEELYLRALAIRERVLGPDHPDTAVSMTNLAKLYVKQRKYEQAELLYQQALKAMEQVPVPDRLKTTIRVLENYIDLLRKMNRKQEAAVWEGQVKSSKAKLYYREE